MASETYSAKRPWLQLKTLRYDRVLDDGSCVDVGPGRGGVAARKRLCAMSRDRSSGSLNTPGLRNSSRHGAAGVAVFETPGPGSMRLKIRNTNHVIR